MTDRAAEGADPGIRRRFAPSLVYQAARLYYLDNATQAEIAHQIGTSRATVSRLLTEARETGIVEVKVRNPQERAVIELEHDLREALGLEAAYVAPGSPGTALGTLLAPGVARALTASRLRPGDSLLISTGATVFAVAQQNLPSLPGVVLCPMVGGVEEPEAHYQSNEITRALASRVGAIPVLLHAPAMPTPSLHKALLSDPHVQRVEQLWQSARAALLGIGAAPLHRTSLPSVIAAQEATLEDAVGDICARPYRSDGTPIVSPGFERLIAVPLHDLRRIPHTIGVAIGEEKADSILVAVHAGYVNTLVTDSPTAELLLRTAAVR
ncbi:sugar-binding domain-containing protein [Nocardia sp. NPDC052112]|uniref:sugar-binding transcriptional regulator n=1 Tax=Nocardia sp. NPDC052112 TaxID=3155646 RepID=UPI00343C5965